MIRLGICVSRDVQFALLKIKDSPEYADFLEKLRKAGICGEGNVPIRQYRNFETAKDRIIRKIDESTRTTLIRLIAPHKSTRKRGLYRSRAIKGYERYAHVLENNTSKIVPEIRSFLTVELNKAISYFRIYRRL